MKNNLLYKSLFLGFFLILMNNGCSVSEAEKAQHEPAQIEFYRSAGFDWKNKKVEVSFEDDFQYFSSIEVSTATGNNKKYKLSPNNLIQGITVQLKIVDHLSNTENISEIMIEPFELSKGLNEFKIGYKNNKPYIIY